jgi:hypothetical protein
MNGPLLLEFVLWSCFALSLVALALLGYVYVLYRFFGESEDEWQQLASVVLGQLVVMAFNDLLAGAAGPFHLCALDLARLQRNHLHSQ